MIRCGVLLLILSSSLRVMGQAAASPDSAAPAMELRISAPALERTLRNQLFNQHGPKGQNDHRHYLRGDATKGCAIYSDEPHVSFRRAEGADTEDRVLVTVKTHAKLGFGKSCFGIGISVESQVSFVPQAEGESVGFRDARIEHVSSNKELDLLLEPFLDKRLPSEMKVNAADMMRKLLVRAPDSTGYVVTLLSLQLHSMAVRGDALIVDLNATVKVD